MPPLTLGFPMDLTTPYSKEYRDYMEYALQRFLIEHHQYSEYDAKIKVMQDFDEVEQQAQKEGYL